MFLMSVERAWYREGTRPSKLVRTILPVRIVKGLKKLYLQPSPTHTREDPCHLTPGSPVGRCFQLERGGGGHDGRGVGDRGGGAVLPLLDPPRADCGAGRAVTSLILFGGWHGCCGPDPMAAPRPTRRAIWHCGHRRAVNPSLLRVSPLSRLPHAANFTHSL